MPRRTSRAGTSSLRTASLHDRPTRARCRASAAIVALLAEHAFGRGLRGRGLVDGLAGDEVDGLEHRVHRAADRGAVAALVPRRQLEVASVLGQPGSTRRGGLGGEVASAGRPHDAGSRAVRERGGRAAATPRRPTARIGTVAVGDATTAGVVSGHRARVPSSAAPRGRGPRAAPRGSTSCGRSGRARAPGGAPTRPGGRVRAVQRRRRAAAASRGSPSARRSACSARTRRW